jgi:hypothetical protein
MTDPGSISRNTDWGRIRSVGTLEGTSPYSGANIMEVSIMNGIIYLVGLVVVILAVLSFFGLR